MEIHGPTASASVVPTTTIAVRAFSKTIAVTYAGLGLFGLMSLTTSLAVLYKAVTSRLLLPLIPSTALLALGAGFMYLIMALHQRRNWARYVAVSFWLLCLLWTIFTIMQNGLHPEATAGPLKYSNADQLAGGRFAALVSPYVLAIVESTAMYCLLRKASVVNQFIGRGLGTR